MRSRKHEADVLQARVPAGVGGARRAAHRGAGGAELLPCPLGDDDDGVRPLFQTTLEVPEKTAFAVELQVDLGDEHEVRLRAGQRGVTGDEPRMPPHHLQQADAVVGAGRLDVGAANRLGGGGGGALEAEAAIDEVDVVVDRLGDPHHGDRQLAPLDLADQLGRPPQRPVAADDEQRPDAHLLQLVDHLAGILAAARGAEDGPAQVVDRADHRRREPQRLVPEPGDDPFEAVAKAEDLLHAVGVGQLEDQPAHDVVDAGTEPAAGHDPDPEGGRIEEQPIAGARQLEGRQRREAGGAGGHQPGGADRRAGPDPPPPRGAEPDLPGARPAASGSDRGRAP